jgi:hypothetical protein
MMTATTTHRNLPPVRQSLLAAKGIDGRRYELVFLLDERCALTCDGRVVEVWDSGSGVDAAVAAMLRRVPAATPSDPDQLA